MPDTYKILFNGQVQGVGFRPHVSKLARKMNITGTVSNNEEGVILMATGASEKVLEFYHILLKNPPPAARINGHGIMKVKSVAFDTFDIVPSSAKGKLNLALTPDFGICPSCSEETSNPDNRRYNYPFTTCVNCGPRWSLTNTFPFERAHTSMAGFLMCPACQSEYEDPKDRRFHSQTNSCPNCGVHLELTDNKGTLINLDADLLFEELRDLISIGKIIAIKNTGGYLLCCDAANPEVIQRLRRLKRRPKKPFAILYPSLGLLKEQLVVNDLQSQALMSTERPIVILSSKGLKSGLAVDDLAPGLSQLGVMLPYSGILVLLSKGLKQPIVATSGNIHGSPVISGKEQSMALISDVADYFLHHNLNIVNAQDDSVVKYSFKHGQKITFRRSRGFAPNYFDHVKKNMGKILALGGHLKSTIAYTPNDYLYISQYLGNLDHFEVYKRFTETTTVFRRIFQEEPHCILTDKHPGYLSSQYGEELSKNLKVPLYRIQHHKAHFASVLGENNLFASSDTILGVIWDGTGYGDDGQIWGGEFFTYRSGEMKRSAYFDYFEWLAGDKMSKEPRLSLFSLHKDEKASFFKDKFSAKERAIYDSVKRSNSLKTSSVGRIFDAVASLLNYCDVNSYEGEGAILLENAVNDYELSQLKVYVHAGEDFKIPTHILWENLYKDFNNGVEKEKIILNFLYTLATVITEMAVLKGSQKIAMSGGVFQNTVLIDMLKELAENKFELFFNRNLAPNDENISYGQLMYFVHCMGKKEYKKDFANQKNDVNL